MDTSFCSFTAVYFNKMVIFYDFTYFNTANFFIIHQVLNTGVVFCMMYYIPSVYNTISTLQYLSP